MEEDYEEEPADLNESLSYLPHVYASPATVNHAAFKKNMIANTDYREGNSRPYSLPPAYLERGDSSAYLGAQSFHLPPSCLVHLSRNVHQDFPRPPRLPE